VSGYSVCQRCYRQEREQWLALRDGDTLHMLPTPALVASIRYLADRLLELTDEEEAPDAR
jgi:hypothetical protein